MSSKTQQAPASEREIKLLPKKQVLPNLSGLTSSDIGKKAKGDAAELYKNSSDKVTAFLGIHAAETYVKAVKEAFKKDLESGYGREYLGRQIAENKAEFKPTDLGGTHKIDMIGENGKLHITLSESRIYDYSSDKEHARLEKEIEALITKKAALDAEIDLLQKEQEEREIELAKTLPIIGTKQVFKLTPSLLAAK